jgi:hypothetical protein
LSSQPDPSRKSPMTTARPLLATALLRARSLAVLLQLHHHQGHDPTGNEKGAHNYIDNLVKERNGARFIDTFEMEVLKSYFTHVRNKFGHGPGSQPMPNFTAAQTDWAIEFAMSWVRTLVRRL